MSQFEILDLRTYYNTERSLVSGSFLYCTTLNVVVVVVVVVVE